MKTSASPGAAPARRALDAAHHPVVRRLFVYEHLDIGLGEVVRADQQRGPPEGIVHAASEVHFCQGTVVDADAQRLLAMVVAACGFSGSAGKSCSAE